MQAPAFPFCYDCERPSAQQCSRCGRSCCRQHGGRRLAWKSSGQCRLGISPQLLCNECTPNQMLLRFALAGIVIFMVAAGSLVAAMTYGLRP